MQSFQLRVVIEKAELDIRLRSLSEFFEKPEYVCLPAAEQNRMARQSAVMLEYSKILGERIAAFK